jgi:hypothetical protein
LRNGRVEQEGDHQQEADVQRAHHQARQGMKRRGDDLEGGEDDRDPERAARSSRWLPCGLSSAA